MDIEVTAEAVGSVPGHSKFGGMPGLAGLVQELAQFKSAPRIDPDHSDCPTARSAPRSRGLCLVGPVWQ